jgi:hypothetical protein
MDTQVRSLSSQQSLLSVEDLDIQVAHTLALHRQVVLHRAAHLLHQLVEVQVEAVQAVPVEAVLAVLEDRQAVHLQEAPVQE